MHAVLTLVVAGKQLYQAKQAGIEGVGNARRPTKRFMLLSTTLLYCTYRRKAFFSRVRAKQRSESFIYKKEEEKSYEAFVIGYQKDFTGLLQNGSF